MWQTARHSNQLVVFDAIKLATNQTEDALITNVQVGTSPVGLMFANDGRYVFTADSNQQYLPGATTSVTVVNVVDALSGNQTFPRIPPGLFPRSLAVSPDGFMLSVNQYDSDAI